MNSVLKLSQCQSVRIRVVFSYFKTDWKEEAANMWPNHNCKYQDLGASTQSFRRPFLRRCYQVHVIRTPRIVYRKTYLTHRLYFVVSWLCHELKKLLHSLTTCLTSESAHATLLGGSMSRRDTLPLVMLLIRRKMQQVLTEGLLRGEAMTLLLALPTN